jgi:hypothetical protein
MYKPNAQPAKYMEWLAAVAAVEKQHEHGLNRIVGVHGPPQCTGWHLVALQRLPVQRPGLPHSGVWPTFAINAHQQRCAYHCQQWCSSGGTAEALWGMRIQGLSEIC